MAKKTKIIEKESKEDIPAPEVTKKQKKAAQRKETVATDIFSESFKQRLSQFTDLNKEISTLRTSVEGSDQSGLSTEREQRVAARVEQAASEILHQELKSLEDWISGEQAKLTEDIKKIERAYEDNRASLLSTGSFSEEEVKSQLISVRRKAEEKEQVFERYSRLLERSRKVYE